MIHWISFDRSILSFVDRLGHGEFIHLLGEGINQLWSYILTINGELINITTSNYILQYLSMYRKII